MGWAWGRVNRKGAKDATGNAKGRVDGVRAWGGLGVVRGGGLGLGVAARAGAAWVGGLGGQVVVDRDEARQAGEDDGQQRDERGVRARLGGEGGAQFFQQRAERGGGGV